MDETQTEPEVGQRIATFQATITIYQSLSEKAEDGEVQRPMVSGIEKVVTDAVSQVWPWLVAHVSAERTDK